MLGRYAIHFHLVGDTMRGSQVLGAAIVDSHNRWITIHGTEYLVVRDCVGYQSVGHGYFLEDGTEVYNLLDRNLGVQAYRRQAAAQAGAAVRPQRRGRLLVGQRPQHARAQRRLRERRVRLPLRHAALEVLQQHAARAACPTARRPRSMCARFRSGGSRTTNRTPKGLYGLVVAGNGNSQPDTPIRDQQMLDTIKGIDWTGPDARHPHIIRGLKIWEAHYAFRPHSPSMLMENVRIHRVAYGIYRPTFDNQVFRNLRLSQRRRRAVQPRHGRRQRPGGQDHRRWPDDRRFRAAATSGTRSCT